EVARRALGLARRAPPAVSASPARSHVGYYLIGPGRPELEARTHYRPPARAWTTRWLRAHPRGIYFGALALVSLFLKVGLALFAGLSWWTVLVVLVGVFLAGEVAVGFVN